MDRIEPDRLDLVREFKRSPLGPHSRELQKVLNIMRWMPTPGKPVVVHDGDSRKWCMGELSGKRGVPVTVFQEQCFDDIGEAFWQLFKIRWQRLTSATLDID